MAVRSGGRMAPVTRRSRKRHGPVRPSLVWLGAGSLTLVLAGCSAGTGSKSPVALVHPTAVTTTTSTTTTTTTTTVPPTTTTTEEPGWSVVGADDLGIALDQRTITGPSGGAVTVIRFRAGRVQFALHVGSQDPPVGTAVIPPNAGAAIGPQETPLLLGAFNGGFKMTAGAGGFEVDGQVLSPLVVGDASLVIDADGSAHIGVWGQSVPTAGEQVVSVRQNLPPLVSGGAPNPTVGEAYAWGAMLGPGPAVPRSALGEDASGNILYAAGMSLVPSDLAAGLVDAGAVDAMELDINPEWVQAVAAQGPGAPLAAMIPGQNRPADQYQAGWSRDFVTALAPT